MACIVLILMVLCLCCIVVRKFKIEKRRKSVVNFISLHSQYRAGCSSARLEYTSGGRVAAGSNPVIPTAENTFKR